MNAVLERWWMLLIRGVCAVLFGVMAFIWPGLTLLVLVMLYAAYALLDGVTALVLGLAGRSDDAPWWGMVLVGMLGIAVGTFTIVWPGLTATALLLLIAAWAIVRGIFEIVAAIRLREVIEDEWLLVLGGVTSIVFGLLVIGWPGAGALALVWVIATYAVVFGCIGIVLSFRLRRFLHGFSYAGRQQHA